MSKEQGRPAIDLLWRDDSTKHLMKWLVPNPNLSGTAYAVAAVTYQAAVQFAGLLGDGPELWAALRFLRQAKDCAVIQSLDDAAAAEGK
jgi:hypothetical protein